MKRIVELPYVATLMLLVCGAGTVSGKALMLR